MNKSAPRKSFGFAIYGVSIALHIALAAGAVLAPKERKSTAVAISLAETRKPPPKKDDTPPPPPPPPPPATKAKVARAPVAEPKPAPVPAAPEPAPAANDAPDSFADLGLAMGNGPGLAVAAAPRAAPPAPRETQRKVRSLVPAHEDACDEPIVKAKLRGALVKPTYTDEARRGQIEGVVRVEMTVDDRGNVIAVKVLKGLGYGLDEAAVAAAKQLTFDPGTRCGKASVTKLTVGMRFALQQ